MTGLIALSHFARTNGHRVDEQNSTRRASQVKICIDSGHGGHDPGAVGTQPFLYEEKASNLSTALQLEDALKPLGHSVIMTRRQDRSLSLSARADFANRHGAALFVSIHANAAATPAAEGMEVFHFPGSMAGEAAATQVLTSMLNQFPNHRNRGVKEGNWAVLRLTHMPAILIECEFITNPDQLLFLHDPQNQLVLAHAIATGIHALA